MNVQSAVGKTMDRNLASGQFENKIEHFQLVGMNHSVEIPNKTVSFSSLRFLPPAGHQTTEKYKLKWGRFTQKVLKPKLCDFTEARNPIQRLHITT